MRTVSLVSFPIDSPNRRHITPFRIAMLLFGLATLVIVLGFVSQLTGIRPHSMGVNFDIVSLVLGVWLFGICLLWRWWRGHLDIFEAPVWFSINLYVQVVANVWLLQRDHIMVVPWLQSNYQVYMPRAVILIGVSLTVFWLAYALQSNRLAHRSEPIKISIQKIPNLTFVFMIWFGSWVITMISVVTGINGYLGTGVGSSATWLNYFRFVNIIMVMAGAILAIHHFRAPSLKGWVWLAVVIISDIVSNLVVGSKAFVYTLIWIAMAIYYARGKFPKSLVLFGLLVVFIFVPVINNYRDWLHIMDLGGGVPLSGRMQALQNSLNEISKQPLSFLVANTSDTFERRQGGLLDITASALYLHPGKRAFLGGEMISYFFPQLIPRVIWPFKSSARSTLFYITTNYLGASEEYTFAAIGMPADAYRAGGWVVVVIWFWVLGVSTAYLYHWGPQQHNVKGTVFYIVCLSQILRYDDPITTTLLALIQFGILLWILLDYFIYRTTINLPPNI